MRKRIDFEEGRYSVVLTDVGIIDKFLRNGEHWEAMDDMIYSNFILSMVQEIQELRKQNATTS